MRLNVAVTLGKELLNKHNLNSWTLKLDSSRSRFGQCRYKYKEIGLSRYLTLLNNESQVKDTILHEIAHALTPRHHHDLTWKLKAIEIGARPVRCYNTKEVTSASKYLLTCSACSAEYRTNRKARRGATFICRKDRTPLELRENNVIKTESILEDMMQKHGLSEEQVRVLIS